ncbi:VanZ family protein [Flavobacterium haoranii]|uniref:VanZ family protein n=1 Tax=Flavobacterium haoranii TaxID=683124 RepID=UPI001266C735|nr:VanZ family protein [Flavobacterium sp.]
MKIIKHLSERNFFWLAIIWTLFITVLCLVSVNDLPSVSIQNKDKITHAMFYFVFVFLWGNAFTKNSKTFFKVFVFAILYGIIIEIFQGVFTETRSADFFDVLANTFGALLGLLLLFIKKIT